MALPLSPRIVYGAPAVTLDLLLPQRYWTPRLAGIGGRDIAASGTPAAYRVRRDYLTAVTLRAYESEWAALRTWIEWAQMQASFDWHPDQADLASVYSVYLHDPAEGVEWAPVRDAEFPSVWELPITLRSANGTPFDLAWHVEV